MAKKINSPFKKGVTEKSDGDIEISKLKFDPEVKFENVVVKVFYGQR